MSIQSNLPRPPLALARSIRAATLRRHVAGRGAPVFSAPSPDPTPLRGRVSRPVGGPCCRSRSRPQPASLTLLSTAKHTHSTATRCAAPGGWTRRHLHGWNLHVSAPRRRAGCRDREDAVLQWRVSTPSQGVRVPRTARIGRTGGWRTTGTRPEADRRLVARLGSRPGCRLPSQTGGGYRKIFEIWMYLPPRSCMPRTRL